MGDLAQIKGVEPGRSEEHLQLSSETRLHTFIADLRLGERKQEEKSVGKGRGEEES